MTTPAEDLREVCRLLSQWAPDLMTHSPVLFRKLDALLQLSGQQPRETGHKAAGEPQTPSGDSQAATPAPEAADGRTEAPCRTTQHCVNFGFCNRCAPALAKAATHVVKALAEVGKQHDGEIYASAMEVVAERASQSRTASPVEPCGQKAGVVVLPHPPHKFMRNARLYQCPGNDTPDAAPGDPATPTDADRLWTLETALRRVREAAAVDQPSVDSTTAPPGGNAEDCPRCAGTNPPYPFICPGHDTPDGLRAQYAEAITQDWYLDQQVVDEITAAVLAVRDREMQQLRRDAADMEQRVIDLGQERRRAEQAEDLLRIAHDTSNRAEAERARAVRRAEQAETRLQHARNAAALHRKQLISTAELHAAIEATPEPAPCPQQCGATHQCPLHTEPSSPAAKAKFTAEAPGQVGALQRQLHRADQARRAREHQLDDIRRALCDAGLIDDEDPYSHADLADVIRQTATEPEPYQQPGQCRYCPDPLCPEDCPECGGPIHDLDTPKEQPGPAATQATESPTICDAYQPPTTAEDSGLCARCRMFDYKHKEQP